MIIDFTDSTVSNTVGICEQLPGQQSAIQTTIPIADNFLLAIQMPLVNGPLDDLFSTI